jgi:hypothetical protein
MRTVFRRIGLREKGSEIMLGTTLGWALVAVAVAIALVPILYGIHLAVVEEKLRHHRAAEVVAIAQAESTACPYCGEHVTADDLLAEAAQPEISIAS